MEVVWLIIGLIVGILIGWFLWNRIGTRRLNDDFAQRLRHSDDQLTTQRKQAEKSASELAELQPQVKEAKAATKEIQKQLDKSKTRIEKLKADAAEAAAAVEAANKQVTEMGDVRAKLAESQSSLRASQTELEGLRLRMGAVDGLEAKLVSAQDRLVEAERAKEDARLRMADAEEITNRATVELDAAMRSISALRAGAESSIELQKELDGAKSRLADLDSTVSRQSEEIAGLHEQLRDATTVVSDELATTAVESEEIIVEAPTDVIEDDAPAAVEMSEPDSPDDGTVDEGNVPDQQTALASMAEVVARTSGGEPATDDDLKRIHGVGPKLETLLKGMGITSYLQVSNFTAADISTVTAALDAFPGRIERDDWVGSAASLYADKYAS